MGEQNTLNPEQAQAILSQEVYVPMFVEKCAALGLQFPDADHLRQALESVAVIKSAESEQQGDVIKQAHDALRKTAGLPSEDDERARAESEKAAAAAAEQSAQQDRIRAAIARLNQPAK